MNIALRVCFIQKPIQDGLINVKQYPTAAQTAHIGKNALLRVLFENFTDQLLGDKHVGDKWFVIRPFLATCISLQVFHLVCVGRMLYLHVLVLLCVCILALYRSWWLMSKGGEMRIAMALQSSVVSLLSTHALRSYIHLTDQWCYEWGGVSESDSDLACVML